MTPLIEFERVFFKYTNKHGAVVDALHDISLEVNQGEFVVIIGHNGSGKSTLAKLINALLIPSDGVVKINGVDTRDSDHVWSTRRSIGFVFQNPDNQIVASTVEEDVAFGPENIGLPSDVIKERVYEAMSIVGVAQYAKRSPHVLSGGQKQRVAIAGALAMDPECIVLDEPTSMLDPKGRYDVLNALLSLRKKKGTTLILVTHFMPETIPADRILVMNNGTIAMDDNPREVFNQAEKLKMMGLDIPQVSEIALRLRKHGLELSKGIITVEELVDELCRLKSEM